METNKTEHVKQEHPEIDYVALKTEILNEINNYEVFKEKKMDLRIFKHSENGKDSTAIFLWEGTKILYKRYIEGNDAEIRYMALYFFYRDVFNNGLLLMSQMAIESEKVDQEKRIIEVVNK
jgi:hypothetical protein